MAVFKIVLSDPKARKSYQLELDQTKCAGIIGKKIGDEFDGALIGLSGYSLQITGGTDKDGFPMHPGLRGPGRKKLLLANPPGFHPKLKGQRKRKTVRGDTISDSIVQINVKVIKAGEKSLEQLIPKKEKPEKKVEEEKPKVEPKKEEVKAVEEKPKKAKPEEKIEKKVEEKKVEKETKKMKQPEIKK